MFFASFLMKKKLLLLVESQEALVSLRGRHQHSSWTNWSTGGRPVKCHYSNPS